MKTKIVNSFIAACLLGSASSAFAVDISVNSRDKHFVRNFSKVSLEVARIGQLAQTRSQDAQVKELGQQLVQAYTLAGQQVANTAQGMDIISRSRLRGSAARTVNKLADLSGGNFDRAALHELYKCEETGVRQLDMEADSNGSGNAALRQSALQVQAAIEPVVWQTAQLNAQLNGVPGHR